MTEHLKAYRVETEYLWIVYAATRSQAKWLASCEEVDGDPCDTVEVVKTARAKRLPDADQWETDEPGIDGNPDHYLRCGIGMSRWGCGTYVSPGEPYLCDDGYTLLCDDCVQERRRTA